MPLGFLFFIAQDSLVSLELSGRRPRCLTASAVSAAENIAKSVQAQIGRTYPHTLIACSDRTSVGLLSGGIPFAAGLELGEHVLIDLIVRLHGDRAPGVFKGDCIIADAAVGGGAVVVPLGAAFLHGIQDVESLLEHAVVDVAGGSTQMDRLLAVILLVGALSSLVPVPGGFGAFHYLVSLALTSLYGIPMETAVIFATLSHESQILTQILCGGAIYAAESFTH